ncbi:MAG: hypothetical protein HZA77_02350 [Candidatus Schekmanbacteria bacterium]|nr:hypothetical protein [Candidatus Schekmanbacteria bacterium]
MSLLGKPRTILFLLIASVFFLSILFPNRDYSYDSIQYVIDAQDENLILHPHHLLFYPTARLACAISSSFLGEMNEWIMPIQLLNIIIFPIAVYFFYSFLVDVSGNIAASILCAAIFAFSGSIWSLSIDNEVHTLELLFFIMALKCASSRKNIILAASMFAIATLYHQGAVLLFPAFVAFFFLNSKEKRGIDGIYFAFSYVAVAGGLFLGCAALDGKRSLSEIIKWFTFYTESGKWGTLTLSNLFYSAASLFQLFFASRVDRRIVFSGNIYPQDYIYLLMEAVGTLSIAFLLIIIVLKSWKKEIDFGIWSHVALIVFIPVTFFAFWWEAQNVEFWLPCLIVMLLLLSIAIAETYKKKQPFLFYLSFFLLIIIFIHNLFSSVIPDSRLLKNETYLFTQKFAPYVSEGDVFINNKKKPVPYLQYYSGKKIDYVSFAEYPLKKWANISEVKNVIAGKIESSLKSNKKVFITSSEILPPEFDPAINDVIRGKERDNFYDAYSGRLKKLFQYTMDGKLESLFVVN